MQQSEPRFRAQLQARSAYLYPELSRRRWYPVVERRKIGVLVLRLDGQSLAAWDIHFDLQPERRMNPRNASAEGREAPDRR